MRLRFPPSPTGYLHVGNARAALFNWLLARQSGGAFVLRIEDTDRERSKPEFEDDILESLRWLGLGWDEGPDVGGPHAPYVQSERAAIYRAAAERLVASGRAFRCFCSEAELAADRELAQAEGRPYVYSGRCRAREDAETRRAACEPHTIRFRMPERPFRFDDMVKGALEFDGALLGDFIVIKSDGMAAYNFAVVVDDAAMAITHVLRGEDHISNTPRQIALYEALAVSVPRFGHLPIILGPDHSKLSKRHGATSVRQFREEGYTPEALVNYLALVGWSPEGTEEVFTLEGLVSAFSAERINTSGAIFDLAKLRWLNAQHLRRLGAEEVARRGAPWLAERLPDELKGRSSELVALVLESLTTLADLPERLAFFQEGPVAIPDDVREKALATPEAPQVLAAAKAHARSGAPWDAEALHTWLKELGPELGLKTKAVMWPIRAAVTGATGGPELYRVLALLGRERVLARLEAATRQ